MTTSNDSPNKRSEEEPPDALALNLAAKGLSFFDVRDALTAQFQGSLSGQERANLAAGAVEAQLITYDGPEPLLDMEGSAVFKGRLTGLEVGLDQDQQDTYTAGRVEPVGGGEQPVPFSAPRHIEQSPGPMEIQARVTHEQNPAADWTEAEEGMEPTNPDAPPYKPALRDVHAQPLQAAERDLTDTEQQELDATFHAVGGFEDALEVADAAVAPHIEGRAVEKLTALLLAVSPVGVPVAGADRFTLTTAFVGDPRTGKDEIAGDVTSLSPPGGFSVNAEVANNRGLAAAVRRTDNGGWVIEWGALPRADEGLLHLKGAHGLGQAQVQNLREALHDGEVSVHKVATGRQDARARLLLTANPRRELTHYPSGLCGFLDVQDEGGNPIWGEVADATRVHLVFPFQTGDVPLSEVDDAAWRDHGREPTDPVITHLIAEAWREPPVDENALTDLRQDVHHLADKIEDRAHGLPLAVVRAERTKVLVALVIASARLRGAYQETDGETAVVPGEADVEIVDGVLASMLTRLATDTHVEQEAERAELAKAVAGLLADPGHLRDREARACNRLAKLVVHLYTELGGRRSAEELGDALSLSRDTVFRAKNRARQAIDQECCPKGEHLPDLLDGRRSQGYALTDFGHEVADRLCDLCDDAANGRTGGGVS